MADEENKNTGQNQTSANKSGNTQNAGGSSNSNKKRRRRPRKRKPSTGNQIQNMAGGPDKDNQKSAQPKKRTRHRPKHRKPSGNKANTEGPLQNMAGNSNKKSQQPKKEEFTLEDTSVMEETPAVEAAVAPVEETTDHGLTVEPLGNKPIQNIDNQNIPQSDSQEDEGGFNLSHIDDAEEAPVEDAPAPEEEFSLDEEVASEPEVEEEHVVEEDSIPEPEEIPAPIPVIDEADAPSDWNQLKEAIKEDHAATEQKMQEQPGGAETSSADIPPEAIPAVVAAGAAMGAAVASEEPQEKSTPEPEPQSEEPEVISPSSLSEDELEKKEVIQIITRYALGGCAVIAIISALFFFRLPQLVFGGIAGLFNGGDAQQEEVVQDDNQTQTDKTKELESTFAAGDNQGTSRDKFEEGVETALVTGGGEPAYEGAPDAIKVLYQTGLEVTSPIYTNRIGTYMAVLLKLQNSFSTDIHKLLDNAKDREDALDVHVRELREIYQDSVDTQQDLNEEKDRLKVQFNEVTTQKEKLEQDFFVSLEKLEGNKSNDLLNSFIETSKRQIELKSEYNALNKASKLFDTAIANMNARIKDIEANRSALIKGVQVVDIKGSDLDLIIQEGDLF